MLVEISEVDNRNDTIVRLSVEGVRRTNVVVPTTLLVMAGWKARAGQMTLKCIEVIKL